MLKSSYNIYSMFQSKCTNSVLRLSTDKLEHCGWLEQHIFAVNY